MLSDLVVMLLEEAPGPRVAGSAMSRPLALFWSRPVLGQRMELEILGILGARKEVPARLNDASRETRGSVNLVFRIPQGHLPAAVSFDEH